MDWAVTRYWFMLGNTIQTTGKSDIVALSLQEMGDSTWHAYSACHSINTPHSPALRPWYKWFSLPRTVPSPSLLWLSWFHGNSCLEVFILCWLPQFLSVEALWWEAHSYVNRIFQSLHSSNQEKYISQFTRPVFTDHLKTLDALYFPFILWFWVFPSSAIHIWVGDLGK